MFCKKYQIPNSLSVRGRVNVNPHKTIKWSSEAEIDAVFSLEMQREVEKIFADDLRIFGYSFEQWREREKLKLRAKKNWKTHFGKMVSVGVRKDIPPYPEAVGWTKWLRTSRLHNATLYSRAARGWMLGAFEVHPRMSDEKIETQIRAMATLRNNSNLSPKGNGKGGPRTL